MIIKYSYFLTEGKYHRIVHDTIDVETFIAEHLMKDLTFLGFQQKRKS